MLDDKRYWNHFYQNKNEEIQKPTRFAEYILNNWTVGRKTFLELGCGNGRDSLYFASNGLDVTAVDSSNIAIDNLKKTSNSCNFLCDDFVESDELYRNKYDICYSRFTIHAIDLESEKKLISNVYNALNGNGIFCVEVRSIFDPLYGLGENVGPDEYFYNNHYRRFLRKNDFIERLIQIGFEILYAEENTGFAPLGNVDPKIIRVVAKRMS